MQATAKDLRFYTKEILQNVKRGEEVIITFRGIPSAKIVSLKKNKPKTKTKLFGIWADNMAVKNVEKYVRQTRSGRKNVD